MSRFWRFLPVTLWLFQPGLNTFIMGWTLFLYTLLLNIFIYHIHLIHATHLVPFELQPMLQVFLHIEGVVIIEIRCELIVSDPFPSP